MTQRKAEDGPFFNVYLSQQGGNVTAVATRDQVQEIQGSIHEGRPFGLWCRQDGGVLTGIIVNPSQGGLVLNVSPSLRIPLRSDGQMAQNEKEVAKWLEPWEQAAASIAYPAWSTTAPDAAAPAPHLEAVTTSAEPPPGPPGAESAVA